MHHLDPGHHLEQLAREMGRSSDPGRCRGELAGIGLGISDELGNRLGRDRWVHHHDVGGSDDARDRGNVADQIEIELFVECRVDCVESTDHEQRIAVRRCAHDRFCANIAAATRPVIDNKLLAEAIRQPLTQQTGNDVGRSAGSEWDDPAHRPRRIGLRPRDPRHGRQRGSDRGQMQEFAAGKLPGRAKLATIPSLTGSSPTPKTIGIVAVAALAASVGTLPVAAITATCRRTRSASNVGKRSCLPSSQWYSTVTFWPSTVPVSLRPLPNAAA